eukprot:TRINITY_DN64518_c0_g1_i1.p1 TRINITY_DN64518_c0_g1~~TRINITY_DN64518_c0_g1_i1.p1  ORF type:complete len:389 (-),score=92.32 TRINITY_DN64518_c0_g1_i1:74-1240(-)
MAQLSVDADEFVPGKSWGGDAADDANANGENTFGQNVEDYLRGGFHSPQLGWWMPYYLGYLKSYNTRTGFGFIECEKTFSIYKVDVYIHKSQVPTPWTLGQYVEFAVTVNNKGQPQANDVMWIPIKAPESEKPVTDEKPSAPRPKLSRHIGILKSFSATQGYGFVSSDDATEKHSCDVYLDRGQIVAGGDCRPGQALEFTMGYNRRGQPQARHVNWEPTPYLAQHIMSGKSIRTLDLTAMRLLNRLLAKLRESPSAAIIAAVDLQETEGAAGSVDYVAFVLERVGEPSKETIDALEEAVPSRLIVQLTSMLAAKQIAEVRVPTALAWCEAILPLLSIAGTGGLEGKNSATLALVSANVEACTKNVEDPARYQSMLDQLTAMMKETAKA